MPCPNVGLKLATASPNGRMPAGEAVQLVVAAPPAGRVLVERHLTDRLGLPDGRRDLCGNDFVCERAHSGEVVRRFRLGHSEGGQDPGAVLVTEHAKAERLLAGCACDDDLLGDQAVRDAQLVGGVADADVDAVPRAGGRIPTAPTRPAAGCRGPPRRRRDRRVSPHRCPAARRSPAGASRRSSARRPRLARRRRSAIAVALRRICHSRCGRLGTYAVNSSRSWCDVPRTWPAAPKWMQSGRFSRIGTPAATMSSSRPGKCVSSSCGAARHQQVHVPALRHRRAVGRTVGQVVAFVHRDPVVEVGEHPRGAHARDACPDDYSVLSAPPHCRRS